VLSAIGAAMGFLPGKLAAGGCQHTCPRPAAAPQQ
jgi:hypothetical protein